jgi:S-adenosylmethionine hydrolase
MPDAPARKPLITLTTDFGCRDSYVAEMKAVLLRYAPHATLVDVTHDIPPQDLLAGAIALERAVAAFGPWTIHVAVIDPGVGSDRRLLLAVVRDQIILCPDNGLITWAWRRHGGMQANEITWKPLRASRTFHGRDVLAPVAGMLAAGQSPDILCKPIADPIVLSVAPAVAPLKNGVVIHVDHFGNAITNVPEELLPAGSVRRVSVEGHDLGPVRGTYSDVGPGKPLALIGSAGLLEIAVRNGSAAQQLGLNIGDEVRFD